MEEIWWRQVTNARKFREEIQDEIFDRSSRRPQSTHDTYSLPPHLCHCCAGFISASCGMVICTTVPLPSLLYSFKPPPLYMVLILW